MAQHRKRYAAVAAAAGIGGLYLVLHLVGHRVPHPLADRHQLCGLRDDPGLALRAAAGF